MYHVSLHMLLVMLLNRLLLSKFCKGSFTKAVIIQIGSRPPGSFSASDLVLVVSGFTQEIRFPRHLMLDLAIVQCP